MVLVIVGYATCRDPTAHSSAHFMPEVELIIHFNTTHINLCSTMSNIPGSSQTLSFCKKCANTVKLYIIRRTFPLLNLPTLPYQDQMMKRGHQLPYSKTSSDNHSWLRTIVDPLMVQLKLPLYKGF